MTYQINRVLNFSVSPAFLFANADPIVTTTMATSMSVLWINPKKIRSKLCFASLKFFKKYFMTGLWKYKVIPIKSWIWAIVAVQWRSALSLRLNSNLKKYPLKALYIARSRLAKTNHLKEECKNVSDWYILKCDCYWSHSKSKQKHTS